MGRKPVFHALASRVREEFLSTPQDGAELPSINELANLYRVSYMTMWKAVDLLAQEGAIDRKHGRRIRAGDTAGKGGTEPTRGGLLARKITADIESGTYHVGEPLPKIEWFTSSYHASRNTMVSLLSRLCESGLIHKSGRQWVVGPAPAPSRSRRPKTASSSVVLLVVPDVYAWQVTFNSAHYVPYISALRNEFMKHGVVLSVALQHQPPQGSPLLPWGIDEVRLSLRAWGGRYLGAVVINIHTERESLVEWAKLLSVDGERPVVYFDSAGTRPFFTRKGLGLDKFYFRTCMDEESGVRRALEHLARHGHRVVGFPVFPKGIQIWAPQRLELVRKCAADMGRHIEVVSEELSEPFWETGLLEFDPMNTTALNDRLERFVKVSQSRTKGAVSGRRRVLDKTVSLPSLLRRGATALIAMNDRVAHQFLWWAGAAGLKIPRDFSLMAFDNNALSETLSLTTVDFGFARTGYLTAHALIGDIPIRTDRHGNIPAVCTVVDRGSVVEPSAGSRLHA